MIHLLHSSVAKRKIYCSVTVYTILIFWHRENIYFISWGVIVNAYVFAHTIYIYSIGCMLCACKNTWKIYMMYVSVYVYVSAYVCVLLELIE